jgi:hypothetical protein
VGEGDDVVCNTDSQFQTFLFVQGTLAHYSSLCLKHLETLGETLVEAHNCSSYTGEAQLADHISNSGNRKFRDE